MYYDLIPVRRKIVICEMNMLNALKYLQYLESDVAAYKIQRGCDNWLNKIKCRDNTYGIRPRIDLTKSELFGDLRCPNHIYKQI
jgi:hypothetical protein